MDKLGGVYIVVIIVAIFMFFWSLTALTGTKDILLCPIFWFIPGVHPQPTNGF